MLRRFGSLKGMFLGAVDGEMGSVKDAFFDDQQWTMRYLVVTTEAWLSGRTVLISPLSIRGINWDRGRFDLDLRREQIQNAPDIDADAPVSRQHELALFDYYRFPYYWTKTEASERGSVARAEQGDPHLRSVSELNRYEIRATDGSIGSVTDSLFEDASWALRYFIVDTRKWLPGGKVLIPTNCIERVSWTAEAVDVAMTREDVRASPEYSSDKVAHAGDPELQKVCDRKPEGTSVPPR